MDFKNYTKQEVAAVCLQYGPILDHYLQAVNATDGQGQALDGASLLFAISGNESSFGTDCKPRHEPAYDWNGKYASDPGQQQLLHLYDSDAACSYGPWQVMLTNAPGFTPMELAQDPEKACTATVGYLNRYVLTFRKATTLAQILETFNSGHWQHPINIETGAREEADPGVEAYVQKGIGYYFNEVVSA